MDIDKYELQHLEAIEYAIENGLITSDMMQRSIQPGANDMHKMILFGIVEGHKSQQKFYAEKRKDERVGSEWNESKKLANCGNKIGEYHTENGPQAVIYHCRLYDKCESCRSYMAESTRRGIERAANRAITENPKMKLRHLKNLSQDKVDARLKRIKRNGGIYRRNDNGDGTVDVLAVIEDSPKKSSEQNQQIFGVEIEPELIYDENDLAQPYERFNLSTMQNYFETAAITNGVNGTRWSGKLNSDVDSGETKPDKIRYTVIQPKSANDWEIVKRIDNTLGNPDPADLETTAIPMNNVADNVEYQTALNTMATTYIEAYREAGVKFEIKSIWRYVKANRFEDWNTAAALNRSIYQKCPNKRLEVEAVLYPTPYLDILPKQAELTLV